MTRTRRALAAFVALSGALRALAAEGTSPSLRGATTAASSEPPATAGVPTSPSSAATAVPLVTELRATVGVLSPAFSASVGAYQVFIRQHDTPLLELSLALKDEEGIEVLANGNAVSRGANGEVLIPVDLGLDSVPVDRTITLTVAGPASRQEIAVRVLRPPDFAALVKPVRVLVLDEERHELTGPLDPEEASQAPVEDVEYLLPTQSRRVGVRLECPPLARSSVWGGGSTGLTVKSMSVDRGVHWLHLDSNVETISGQCLYEDPRWTRGGTIQGRTFILTFRRGVGSSGQPALASAQPTLVP